MLQGRLENRAVAFWGALLASLALALMFGWELLIPGRSLYRWDMLLYNWPIVVETRTQWLSGRWPFWASAFCCGTPLLPNINAGVLYPLRLPCWVLPMPFGYHVFLFGHIWLTFLCTHLFFRSGLRLPTIGAFVGVLAFGAGGYARAIGIRIISWHCLGYRLAWQHS